MHESTDMRIIITAPLWLSTKRGKPNPTICVSLCLLNEELRFPNESSQCPTGCDGSGQRRQHVPGAGAPRTAAEQDRVCTEPRARGGAPAGDELETRGCGSPRGLATAGGIPGPQTRLQGALLSTELPSHLHSWRCPVQEAPPRPAPRALGHVFPASVCYSGKASHGMVTNKRARQMCGISEGRAGCRRAGQ